MMRVKEIILLFVCMITGGILSAQTEFQKLSFHESLMKAVME